MASLKLPEIKGNSNKVCGGYRGGCLRSGTSLKGEKINLRLTCGSAPVDQNVVVNLLEA